MSSATKTTYENYLQLPEDSRYEIIDGELYMVPAPVPYHQKVSRNLEYYLHQHVKENNLGEVFYAPCDVILSNTDVVQPDLFFISQARLSIIKETNIQGAPDLVVEILSPASEQRDRGKKQKLYAQNQIQEYWIVDTQTKSIEILQFTKSEYIRAAMFQENDTLRSDVFPNLTIPMLHVF